MIMLTILIAAIVALVIVVSGSIVILLWAALRMHALIEQTIDAEEELCPIRETC